MKLAEALTKLRNLKSQVARVEGYIDECATYWENDKPAYDFQTEDANRAQIVAEITKLKVAIQVTNATTKTTLNGTEYTLSELILLNANIRSELAYIQKLMNKSLDATSLYERRTKEDLKKVYATGFNKVTLRQTYEALEKSKEVLEGILNNVNLQTDLVTV